MNAPEKIVFLPDVQSNADSRDLPIDAVGIKGVRYPVTLRAGRRLLSTIATYSMTVGLSAAMKGTHMSRFVEVLEAQEGPLDRERFETMLAEMLHRMEARHGTIEMRFPYFVRKTAPVSRIQSELDYDVCWRAALSDETRSSFAMHVTVPATSLCPCSKEISEYGAYNQRSHIGIEVELAADMAVEELIGIAERAASSEVYGLLKRADEKYVTERAYDNPRFVEDLVRDVAIALDREPRVHAYVVEAENFESIHNHSAIARIVRPRRAAASPPLAAPQSRHVHSRSTEEHG